MNCPILVPILNPGDPRIEAYRTVRERDLVGRTDRFIAEGEVVLRTLLTRSCFGVESLLIGDNRIDPLSELLAHVPAGTPVYTASRSVMDSIVGFPIHRGILAVGIRPPMPEPKAFLAALPPISLVVGLVGLANHDNVGGIFRNAAAFGAEAILLDQETCDPLYRKAIRVSVGAAVTVPHFRLSSPAAIVEALREAGFDILSLTPAGREKLGSLSRSRRTALLLGAEGHGLPPSLLAATRTISIPMRNGFDSLNVATTSGIVLHHLTSQDSP